MGAKETQPPHFTKSPANEIIGNSDSHICSYLGNYLSYSINILQGGCPITPLDAQILQAMGGAPGAVLAAP